MKKGNSIRLILIIIIGFIGGIFFISPFQVFTKGKCTEILCKILQSLDFNYNQIMSGFLGILVLLLLIFIVLNITPQGREKTKETYKTTWAIHGQYFSHPTQRPMMLGIIWFLFFIFLFLIGVIESISVQYQNFVIYIFLLPSFFLLGFSGFLMIRRKEYVDKMGYIHKGTWAIFNGFLAMLLGWGGLFALILASISN